MTAGVGLRLPLGLPQPHGHLGCTFRMTTLSAFVPFERCMAALDVAPAFMLGMQLATEKDFLQGLHMIQLTGSVQRLGSNFQPGCT